VCRETGRTRRHLDGRAAQKNWVLICSTAAKNAASAVRSGTFGLLFDLNSNHSSCVKHRRLQIAEDPRWGGGQKKSNNFVGQHSMANKMYLI
jgi:hypothetical protein